MASYDSKRKTWRASINIDGVRFQKRGFLSKQIAELWENQQLINHQRHLVNLPVDDQADLRQVIANYLDYANKYKAKNTSYRESWMLRRWCKFFDRLSIRLIHEIPKDLVYRYISFREMQTSMREMPPKPSTLNIEVRALILCFDWCVERGLIAENPIKNFKPLKVPRPGLPRYLTKEEIAVIEEAAAIDMRQIIAVLVRTGMRVGELCALDMDDIDFGKGQIILRPESTKSRYMRAIPFGGLVADILRELCKNAVASGRKNVFATATGRRQTGENIWHRLKTVVNALERAGQIRNARGITVHTMRRTFISHMIMAGADPASVMAIVGHQDWSTVKRYLVLSPGHLVGEIGKLPY